MKPRAFRYTVRGVPLEVDRILKERAKRRKVSINQVIVDELTRATIGQRQLADLSDVVGRWTDDDAFDEMMAGQRQVDIEGWR